MNEAVSDSVLIPAEPIMWHDGLLLAPVHFEQLVQRQEELLTYHARSSAPYAWGVRRLRLDTSRLAEGELRLIEIEAIMPDGLLVTFGQFGGDIVLLIKPEQLAEFHERGSRCLVHLAVPLASHERFRDARRDTGGVARNHPKLALSLDSGLSPATEVSLPIAKLKFEGGQVALDTFLPPLLEIGVRLPHGGQTLGAQAEDLASRLRTVAGRLRNTLAPGADTSDGQLYRLELREQLRSVSSALPLLTGLLGLERVAPVQLYLALCAALGPLEMLRLAGPEGAGVPPYRHLGLGETFGALFARIDQLLETARSPYKEYPLALDSERFYLRLLPVWMAGWPTCSVPTGAQAEAPRAAPVLLFGLRGLSDEEARYWLDNAAIASAPTMEALRQRRMRGVQRHLVGGDGALLPVAGAGAGPARFVETRAVRAFDMTVFALELDPELVSVNQDLVFYGSVLPRPREIVLFAAAADADRAP